ncbi:MAG: O-antigen ligase family protein, partial [Candidatus Sumerlaeaceae bacterium]|nr:O-antigen ligase family protein [Candidatus Sumerlaeaceae bacterium]
MAKRREGLLNSLLSLHPAIIWVCGFLSVVLVSTDRVSERPLLAVGGFAIIFSTAILGTYRTFFTRRTVLAAAVCGLFFSGAHTWQNTAELKHLALSLLGGAGVASVLVLAALAYRETVGRGAHGTGRWIRLSLGTLLAYFLWEAVGTVWSENPGIALKLFTRELCVYVGVFFFATWSACSQPSLARLFAKGAGAAVTVVCVLMLIVASLHVIGALPSSLLNEEGWIRIGPAPAEWRLQFPFQHHNRAGFFGMCAAFLIPAFVLSYTQFSWRTATGSALVGVIISLLSLTRGAQLGVLVGGISTLAALTGVRTRITLIWATAVAFIFVAVVFLSPHQRGHWLESILVTPNRSVGTQTSLGNRLIIQSITLELISKKPLQGYGYGSPIFEKVTSAQYPGVAANIEGMSHPHNFWLEKVFAAGIPGALCFLAFTFSRLAALASVIRTLHRQQMLPTLGLLALLALWFGLEIGIQAYGLTNTVLRR